MDHDSMVLGYRRSMPYRHGARRDGRICRARAPQALTGNLGDFTCNREVTRSGIHAGDHRAHLTIIGVGRVNFLWPQTRHLPPPVIELPRLSADELQHLRKE